MFTDWGRAVGARGVVRSSRALTKQSKGEELMAESIGAMLAVAWIVFFYLFIVVGGTVMFMIGEWVVGFLRTHQTTER